MLDCVFNEVTLLLAKSIQEKDKLPVFSDKLNIPSAEFSEIFIHIGEFFQELYKKQKKIFSEHSVNCVRLRTGSGGGRYNFVQMQA